MITEQGIVEKAWDRKAIVRVQKSSACAQCSSRDSCNIPDRVVELEVSNDLQAKVGDHVEISVPEGAIVKLSMLVYLLPIIALMIGAFAGGLLAEAFRINSTPASVFGGVLLMVITFYGLRRLERAKNLGNKYQPRMTRIVVSAGPTQPGDNI